MTAEAVIRLPIVARAEEFSDAGGELDAESPRYVVAHTRDHFQSDTWNRRRGGVPSGDSVLPGLIGVARRWNCVRARATRVLGAEKVYTDLGMHSRPS